MGETTTTRRRRKTKAVAGPTLHDVARAAGVSAASASRALSRPELVSERVHSLVTAATRSLAYIPNAAAQALSGRSSRLVGAVVPTLDDPVTMLALDSLTRELAARGVALMLSIAGEGTASSAECVSSLVARGADLIVFCGGTTPIEPGALHPDRGVRLAYLDEAASDGAWAWSGFERAKAFALGARYLQQLGHVRIGFLAIGGCRGVDAIHGLLRASGIDVVGGIPPGEPDSGGTVSAAVDRWRGLPAPPTGIVCGSDLAAVALLGECKRREIVVPAQWSVIGFGDTELSRQVQPALTTLRVPAREAGRALARILLASLEGHPETPPELFAKVVARESTVAIRA
jgi:DNA-binding LacI/PurR family transcriptional regulator